MSEVGETPVKDAAADDWGRPGTRKWRWAMRITNVLLFVAPLYPLTSALSALVDPQVLLRASRHGVQATTPHGAVDSVLVSLEDPGFVDYLLLCGPGLVMFVMFGMLAVICRALYRIAINFSGNPRPYTERDAKVLRLAHALPLGCWALLFGISIASYVHYRGTGSPDTGNFMILTIVLMVVMQYVWSLYKKGEFFYKELEKGV